MGTYDVEFKGVHIKTRVVDHFSMVEQALEELKAALPSTRLVAVDVKSSNFSIVAEILVLTAGGRCVIFKILSIQPYPKVLYSFLGDKTILFVGHSDKQFRFHYNMWPGQQPENFSKVGLGELAARVLKKPKLCGSSKLEEIAKEIGQGVEVPFCPQMLQINCKAMVYSAAEVKELVGDAHACFILGSKLLSML